MTIRNTNFFKKLGNLHQTTNFPYKKMENKIENSDMIGWNDISGLHTVKRCVVVFAKYASCLRLQVLGQEVRYLITYTYTLHLHSTKCNMS